jgi:hypothetical protein
MFKFYDFMEGAGGDFHNTRFAESPKRENLADWFEPVAMQKIERSKCKIERSNCRSGDGDDFRRLGIFPKSTSIFRRLLSGKAR